tara:strand:+ start:84 stop:440 length:357 start_codon:yes stop_codon:yes gene_type:complete
MASIVYSNNNAKVNPTTNYLPINVNGEFLDSELNRPNDGVLQTNFSSGAIGLQLNSTSTQFTLGDFDNIGNNTKIIVDDTNNTIKISAATVGGAHLPTATFLKISVNGSPYVLGLLAP